MELVLGDHGRSGGQYDIWQAVFGPQAADGYPAPIFDKQTGEIDPKVAAYWREHFDLTHIIQRDWATLGPKLAGQAAHLCRLGRHLFPDRRGLFRPGHAGEPEATRPGAAKSPMATGPSTAGTATPSCANAYSRLHYNTMYLPKILERIADTAPPGADLTSWRY